MLAAKGISKMFGPISALENVTLNVRRSSIHGLIGPNGAGKTTLVNILTGYVRPDWGTVEFDGASINKLAPFRRARAGISRTFQTPRLFEDLTVEANIRAGLPRRALASDPTVREIAILLEVVDDLANPIKMLPAGERRLIEIARSLVGKPKILLLDEPFAGLSGSEIERVSRVVQTLCKQLEIGVLLIEHNLAAVFSLASDLSVLDRGQIVAAGPAQQIASSAEVRRIFFGGEKSVSASSPGKTGQGGTNAKVVSLQGVRSAALIVRDLHAGYGRLRIVRGIDLSLGANEVVGIVGVNGAGKSTLLRALAGTIRSQYARFEIAGEEVVAKDVRSMVRRGVVLVPEGRHLFPSLSTEDNLRLAGTAAGLSAQEMAARLDRLLSMFPHVREFQDRPAGSLSGGQQQSVAIVRALMSKPKVLLLDEPSIGLSVPAIDALVPLLNHLVEHEGISLLLAEQNLYFAERLCSRSYLIDGGMIVAEGGAELINEAWNRASSAEPAASARDDEAGTSASTTGDRAIGS
jgi:branched-chain amino acid transport system ATP-binding protein